MQIRAVRKGFRSRTVVIATTLLDGAQYSAEDVAGLYLQRWTVELFFRDIKTSMGTEMLNGRSRAWYGVKSTCLPSRTIW